jgi:hypothetical protein
MNDEVDKVEDEDDLEEDVDSTDELVDTVVMDDIDDDDNVGDTSVEINVEELVAMLEAGGDDAERHRKEIHRRIEDLNEQRRIEKELENTFNFNLDDDL